MHTFMKLGLLTALLLLAAVPVMADNHGATSTAMGALVGDAGGAFVEWAVDYPASTDVTLTLVHSPCVTGTAVGVDAYDATGMLGKSSESDACTQLATFNTGSGGAGKIRVFNYLPNTPVNYILTTTGVVLPDAAPAPDTARSVEPEEAAPAEAEGEAAGEGDAAAAVEPEGEAAVEAQTATEPQSGTLADNAVLVGNSGGAHDTYTVDLTAGDTVTFQLIYSMANGGTWTGIGVDVWAPDGTQVTGAATDVNLIEAPVTAGMTGSYTVQVSNYNHGETMHYSLLGIHGGQEG